MNAQAIGLHFANALNRERDLMPNETDMLCALIGGTKRTTRIWTAADDRELQRMIRKGQSSREIAEATGRSAMAVRVRKHRLKVQRHG
jgi:DNA-binding NarL/FixJ family response regulator